MQIHTEIDKRSWCENVGATEGRAVASGYSEVALRGIITAFSAGVMAILAPCVSKEWWFSKGPEAVQPQISKLGRIYGGEDGDKHSMCYNAKRCHLTLPR